MEAHPLIIDTPDDDTLADVSAGRIYGTFVVGGREVTLPAEDVREVVVFPEALTLLPRVPPYVLGVFSLRGEVLPVIDVASLLGIPSAPPSPGGSRIAVVDCGTHHVGAVFDATGEVLEVEAEAVQPLRHRPDAPERIVSGLLSLDEGRRLVQVLSAELIAHVDRIPRGTRRDLEDQRVQPMTKLAFVRVAGTVMGIRVERVLEIHPSLPLAMEVQWFEGCVGVVELRGESIAVVALAEWLGRPETPLSEGRMVFVTDGRSVCALHVDAVLRVADVPDEDFVAVPILEQFGCGVCIREVVRASGGDALVLDVPRLFDALGVAAAMPEGNGAALLHAEEVGAETDDRTWLGVALAEHVFGLDMAVVREIRDFPETLLHHPAADQQFLGLMNLRGEVVPVVDLRPSYGLTGAPPRACKVVVLEVGGGRKGIVVDALRGIFHDTDGTRTDALLSVQLGGQSSHRDHVVGILHLQPRLGGGGVLLLDVERALNDEPPPPPRHVARPPAAPAMSPAQRARQALSGEPPALRGPPRGLA